MKQIKFRGIDATGKLRRGYFLSPQRPNNAQRIAERIVGSRLTKFVPVVIDIKEHMIKCETPEEE